MRRLFLPSFGPSDWRRFLADPATQWRAGKSAYELAVAWEAARGSERGLPPVVAALFDSEPTFADARLLLGIPEHQVPLDGGRRASQTDLWALIDTRDGVVSAAVEGKAGEAFDKPVVEWIKDAPARSGKPARLEQLCRELQISRAEAETCRYQLLHRTVVALLEARRFRLTRAILLIQSFVPDRASFADYGHFLQHFGVRAEPGVLQSAGAPRGVELWAAWLDCPPADGVTIRTAV